MVNYHGNNHYDNDFQNPVAVAFEIFWMLFEPILFGVTGTQIILSELEGDVVYLAVSVLLAGIVLRMIVTVLVGVGSNLNLKEKIFIAFACMAKATVQAALGPALFEKIDPDNDEQKRLSEVVLMVCVLSILITAPTGAFIIMMSGPKLLTKTKASMTPTMDPRARSRRPSIRDISIINEVPDEDSTSPTSTTVTESFAPTTLHNNLMHNNQDNHHR